MTATLLADSVLFIHLLLAALMTAGLVLIPLGARLRWDWVRVRWLRITHLGLMILIALEALFGLACPLTILEYSLRGQEAPTHFLAEWMGDLLYWDAPVEAFVALYLLCALWLVMLWWVVPPEPRRAGIARRMALQAQRINHTDNRPTLEILPERD